MSSLCVGSTDLGITLTLYCCHLWPCIYDFLGYVGTLAELPGFYKSEELVDLLKSAHMLPCMNFRSYTYSLAALQQTILRPTYQEGKQMSLLWGNLQGRECCRYSKCFSYWPVMAAVLSPLEFELWLKIRRPQHINIA